MKLQTLLFLFFSSCCITADAFVQKDTIEVARLDEAHVVIYSIPESKYLLTWKNGNKTRSKVIFTEDTFSALNVSIETQQLDGNGHEELLIYRSYEYMHSYGADNGGWSVEKQATVIFNLDTWLKMFEAVSFMSTASEEVTMVNDTVPVRESWYCLYRYTFEIDSANHVRISELKTEHETVKNGVVNHDSNSCPEPDHQPGTYIIKNGVYVRKEI
jgi:hypothetical protein